MGKLLSVIIPHYAETPAELTPAFSSVNNQVGIDWKQIEVLLVNDANPDAIPPREWFDVWHNLHIRTVVAETNAGPGVARQLGIDNAIGDYVLFIDADDCLHSVGVLGAFLQEIDQKHPDLITTPWLEEMLYPDGRYSYLTHDNERTWMFGKAFRRRWLEGANIRMHPELRVHEDSYFNALAFSLASLGTHMPITSYVWRWNPESTVRRNNGAYRFNSAETFIRAHALALERLANDVPQNTAEHVTQLLAYHYAFCLQGMWKEQPEYMEQVETALVKYLGKYFNLVDTLPEQKRADIINNELIKHMRYEMITETWGDWWRRMFSMKEGLGNAEIN